MRSSQVFAAILAFFSLASLARAEADLSTPEKTIESFAAALNDGKSDDGLACVLNSRRTESTDEFFDSVKTSGLRLELKVVKVKIDGDNASATVRVTTTNGLSRKETNEELVALSRTGDKWQIKAMFLSDGRAMINNLAIGVARSDLVIKQIREAKLKAECIGQIKQLALAFLMRSTDYDDRLPPKADSWKKAVQPYIQDIKILTCPLDRSGTISYSYNHNIAGKCTVELDLLTVLVYEGSKGKLNFRHGGKAAVAFVDGSARMVTPEEAKKLKWK